MASRRRRRKSIGKVFVDVERRVRRVEKRPGAKRLRRNVVTTEKLGFRAVTTKTVAADAITANEAAFGTTVVTDTEPTEVKDGTTWINPDDGSANVYSLDLSEFITITDAAAVAIAQGKNKTYVQDNEPTGGSYSDGDLWIDTNDGNKLYRYSGTAWVSAQDTAISTAQSTANGKNKVFYSTSAPGSTANTAGDIWWQYSSGIVVGQYVGAGGTSWTSAPIGNAVIANLDAGKITTGYLDVAGTVRVTTSATASGTGGFTPRIEINSNGFFAYDGTVATVSITNTGSAIFSGTVNASGGSFTGYVTAGTARIGAGVQTGKNGLYINANNYWYDDATFKVGDGTESMSYTSAGGLVVTGEINATGGNFTGYVTAGNMRIGSNVDSTSEGIYVNANNYWYDTGSFKVGDGTESMSYTSAGGLVVTGEINANSGVFSGTITATGTISGGTISGSTITGSSFTSTNFASGTGIGITTSSSIDSIKFRSGGVERASFDVVSGGLIISAASASITMTSAGAISIASANNTLLMSAAPYFTQGSGSNTGGGLGSLRNTWASSSDPSGGDLGDVWLKWV